MIRKLKKDDHESVIALGHKPAENLFIIGDIEALVMILNFKKFGGNFKTTN